MGAMEDARAMKNPSTGATERKTDLLLQRMGESNGRFADQVTALTLIADRLLGSAPSNVPELGKDEVSVGTLTQLDQVAGNYAGLIDQLEHLLQRLQEV